MFTKSHYFDFDIITFKPGHFFSCGEANFRDFFPCILVQLGDFLRDKVGDFRFGLFLTLQYSLLTSSGLERQQHASKVLVPGTVR